MTFAMSRALSAGLENDPEEETTNQGPFDSDAFRGLTSRLFVNSLAPSLAYRSIGTAFKERVSVRVRQMEMLKDKGWTIDRANSIGGNRAVKIFISHSVVAEHAGVGNDYTPAPYLTVDHIQPMTATAIEASGAPALAQSLVAACRQLVPSVRSVQTAIERDPEEGTMVLRLLVTTAGTVDQVFQAENELNVRIADITSEAPHLEAAVTYDFVPA